MTICSKFDLVSETICCFTDNLNDFIVVNMIYIGTTGSLIALLLHKRVRLSFLQNSACFFDFLHSFLPLTRALSVEYVIIIGILPACPSAHLLPLLSLTWQHWWPASALWSASLSSLNRFHSLNILGDDTLSLKVDSINHWLRCLHKLSHRYLTFLHQINVRLQSLFPLCKAFWTTQFEFSCISLILSVHFQGHLEILGPWIVIVKGFLFVEFLVDFC